MADELIKNYIDMSSFDTEEYEKKPLFSNLHPASKRYEAILACRGGA